VACSLLIFCECFLVLFFIGIYCGRMHIYVVLVVVVIVVVVVLVDVVAVVLH